jgi:hypothetical protein
MADGTDIVKTTNLPSQEPLPKNPISEQERRLDSTPSDSKLSRIPTPVPSSGFSGLFSPPDLPSAVAPDSRVAQMLAAPVSSSSQTPSNHSVVSELLKNLTVNGYPVDFQNGNLNIRLGLDAFPSLNPNSPRSVAQSESSAPSPAGGTPPVAPAPPAPHTEPPPPAPAPAPAPTSAPAPAPAPAPTSAPTSAPAPAPAPAPTSAPTPNTPTVSPSNPSPAPEPSHSANSAPAASKSDSAKSNEDIMVDQVLRNVQRGDGWHPSALASNEEKEAYKKVVSHLTSGTDLYEPSSRNESRSRGEGSGRPDTEALLSTRQGSMESGGEYRDRKKILKNIGEEGREAVRAGDSTFFGKGLIPIYFSRADKARKVLMFVEVSHTEVIEGAVGNERKGELPEDSGYYMASVDSPHPWQVSLKQNDGAYEYQVESKSNVYKSFENYEKFAVTGLGSWQSASEGFIFLSGTVEELTVQQLTIEGPKDDIGERVTFSGDDQTKFTVPIAYIFKTVSGGTNVRQLQFQDLTMIDTCIKGKVAVIPMTS